MSSRSGAISIRRQPTYILPIALSPSTNSELFNAVIGGYGMFAIILDAELETVPNNVVNFNAHYTSIIFG